MAYSRLRMYSFSRAFSRSLNLGTFIVALETFCVGFGDGMVEGQCSGVWRGWIYVFRWDEPIYVFQALPWQEPRISWQQPHPDVTRHPAAFPPHIGKAPQTRQPQTRSCKRAHFAPSYSYHSRPLMTLTNAFRPSSSFPTSTYWTHASSQSQFHHTSRQSGQFTGRFS